MSNSIQNKTNRHLTIEVENTQLDKTVILTEEHFNPFGMGSTEYREQWDGKELQVSFQHLPNCFMNVSIYWGDEIKLMMSCKASNEEGLVFSCSLGEGEMLRVRSRS